MSKAIRFSFCRHSRLHNRTGLLFRHKTALSALVIFPQKSSKTSERPGSDNCVMTQERLQTSSSNGTSIKNKNPMKKKREEADKKLWFDNMFYGFHYKGHI
jgi:hypothetical protein